MAKKKGRVIKKQNQTSGRRRDSKRKDSSTSTSTDFNSDLFIGVDRLNLNEEDENFFRNLVLSNKVSTNLQQSRPKGLVNLGNTCYLNSVIQVLSQTPFFYELLNNRADAFTNWTAINRDYFKNLINLGRSSKINREDFKLICKLGAPSILVSCLVSLLRNLRSELKSSSSVVTPNNFVREITSSFAQFKNYDQQDSHEFLRCLLDAIRINEIGRQRKSILEALNLDFKKIKLIKENDVKLSLIKAYSDSSNFTVIDSLFGGYCISSLKCEDCNFTSQIFEPFFDLSIPISEESDIIISLNYHNNLNKRQQPRFTVKQNNKQRIAKGAKIQKQEPEIDAVNAENLVKTDKVKNLSTKERKLRRQLKKANRRQNKKVNKLNDDDENDSTINKKDEKREDKNNQKDENCIDLKIGKDEKLEDKNSIDLQSDKYNKKINDQSTNELKANKYYKKSSTLDEEDESESDGESSDDEASSNEFSELKNDLSEDYTSKLEQQSTSNKNCKTVQSNNSVDSGINSSNLASEADNNYSSRLKSLTKSSISPVHEEQTDCEQQFKSEECMSQINNTDKETDTGFEDRNVEADSEESNSEKIDEQADDSEEEKPDLNNQVLSSFQDNDNVFNDENEEERKSVRSSAMSNSDLFKRKIKWTLSTVSNRNEASISCSVLAGLARFTKPDILVGANKILCENCSEKFKAKNGVTKKIYTNGSKQMLIALPPAILTLQLKRFELSNYRSSNLSKINKFVHFPLVLDLSPYVSNIYKAISGLISDYPLVNENERNTKSIIYSLYGIIEHSGSLRSGHYKAYVRCNNKESSDLKRFIRMQPYVPKVADLMDLITLNDLEKVEEDQELNEMLLNMNLSNNQQLNGDCSNETVSSAANPEVTNQIKEELIKATKEKWFHLSDSNVTQVQLKTVLKAQAYLLFYERRY